MNVLGWLAQPLVDRAVAKAAIRLSNDIAVALDKAADRGDVELTAGQRLAVMAAVAGVLDRLRIKL